MALSELLWPLSTVLTAALKLPVDDMAPLRLLLTWDKDVDWPPSTVLTAVLKLATAEALELREALWLASTTLTAELRLDVEEIAPLREALICETDTERPISGAPLGPLGCNGSPI